MTSRPVEIGSPYFELIKPIARTTKGRLVLEILTDYVRVRWLHRRAAICLASWRNSAVRHRARQIPVCKPSELVSDTPSARLFAPSLRLALPRPLARVGGAVVPPWHRLDGRDRRRRRSEFHGRTRGSKAVAYRCFRPSTPGVGSRSV